MTVINVYNYNNKKFIVCYAKAKAMILDLIDRKYITGNFEIPYGQDWLPLKECFGEDWCDIISEWDVENFTSIIEDYLIIQEVEVID